MNLHLMIRETNRVGATSTYTREYSREEYEEVCAEADRTILDAGEVVTSRSNGCTIQTVRMDVLALKAFELDGTPSLAKSINSEM